MAEKISTKHYFTPNQPLIFPLENRDCAIISI